MKKKKKKNLTTIILIAILVAGLSLLLYPTVSNYVNEKNSARAISTYVEDLSEYTEEDFRAEWEKAEAYNRDLAALKNQLALPEEMAERYKKTLDITGKGIMGYIEIAKLDVEIPIYHGTEDHILQHFIGHVDWTSLPTGGESTHCVVSGHRGLPSAKLFTELDKLREGDTFVLTVLDQTLTYEVDQIRTVLPEETEELQIQQGRDYCTLVTCTPYGINTHRLLVRGHRIENVLNEAHVVAEATVINGLIVAAVLAVPVLILLLIVVLLKKPKETKRKTTRKRTHPYT